MKEKAPSVLPMWKRTLQIFSPTPVTLQLRDGSFVMGELDQIRDADCTVKRPDGSFTVVDFDDLRGCEPTRLA